MSNQTELAELRARLLFIGSTEMYLWCGLAVPIILGNLITIVAVWKDHRLHTASNFLVAALAVADLLVGAVSILRTLIANTVTLCSVVLSIFQVWIHQIAVLSTMTLLLLIAVDRFVAIIYPLRYDQYITMRTAKIMVLVSYCLVALTCSTYFVWAFVGDQDCATFLIPPGHLHPLSMGLYGCIALCLFTIYFKIHLIAQKHRRQIEDSSRRYAVTGTDATQRRKKRTTRMLFVILIIYLIAWLPYIVMTSLGAANKTLAQKYPLVFTACRSAFRCLGLSNSGVNFFVYAWTNKDFRRAYLRLLCWEGASSLVEPTVGDGLAFQNSTKSREPRRKPTTTQPPPGVFTIQAD